MPFCHHCGSQEPEGMAYCGSCGQLMPTSSPTATNSSTSKRPVVTQAKVDPTSPPNTPVPVNQHQSASAAVVERQRTQPSRPGILSGISRRTILIGGLVTLGSLGIASAAWRVSTSLPAPRTTPHPPILPYTYHGTAGSVYAVAWSPDGGRLAVGNNDGTVQVWDTTNGSSIFIYRGHSNWVYAMAWSPDGSRIASASQDRTVRVWDATDGGHVFTYGRHSGPVTAVTWSPDGKRLASASAGWDHTVQVWDAADGAHVFIYRGHSDSAWTVAWSPDGKRLASAGDDRTVQVWDAANGSHVFTYHGHSDSVAAVAWSPDNKCLASASLGLDDTVQVETWPNHA